jgi:hypothetical protein
MDQGGAAIKHIYTHYNIMVLHSVKNILSMHSIESIVKNEHTVPVGPQHGINNIFHELWLLNDEDFDKATAIIESEFENPDPGIPWYCSKCGEENEGNFEVCWNCQSVHSN